MTHATFTKQGQEYSLRFSIHYLPFITDVWFFSTNGGGGLNHGPLDLAHIYVSWVKLLLAYYICMVEIQR